MEKFEINRTLFMPESQGLNAYLEKGVLLFYKPKSPISTWNHIILGHKHQDRLIFEDAFSPIRHSSAVPTLKSVSEKLHLSEKQTERMIKSFFGRSFGEQVSYMRMTRAKELLETTDMKVNAISSAVGYSVTRSFFGAFKKTYGMTPNEYRKARKRDCI